MTGHRCIVCGNTSKQDPSCSFHRFPSSLRKKTRWLQVLEIDSSRVKPDSRVCARHFPAGDVTKDPQVNLGKKFASPIKKKLPRTKRAKTRESIKYLTDYISPASDVSSSTTNSTVITPIIEEHSEDVVPTLTTAVGEQLCTEYQVHELPSDSGDCLSDSFSTSISGLPSEISSQFDSVSTSMLSTEIEPSNTEVLVNTALLARIESLEAENNTLRLAQVKTSKNFCLEQIQGDDGLFRFYTGFPSFEIFLAFFEFLGPVVHELNYWGSKQRSLQRHYECKLNPINQLFLTLIKLRLNLKGKDLAFRFGISTTSVSRYVTTWICFLYHHLKELDWSPTVQQVIGTLPHSFRRSYPDTYAIIDGSEVFLETPSDLYLQSSTWSQYKHHNTAKFLVACTPNGAISFISPVYVGSISDVQLTSCSGFLETLKDKPGISIMADRGFTIKDMLKKLNIELNLPPFMEGRSQLPALQVQKGRKIASLRIHVERAIGRIKNYTILKGTIPLSMARIINQIVCVCAFLSNFHPALVPPPEILSESDVEDYLNKLSDSDDESACSCSE